MYCTHIKAHSTTDDSVIYKQQRNSRNSHFLQISLTTQMANLYCEMPRY